MPDAAKAITHGRWLLCSTKTESSRRASAWIFPNRHTVRGEARSAHPVCYRQCVSYAAGGSLRDIICSLFAPTPEDEFLRVLKPDGVVVCAVPGEDHLWELKCAVYDKPYQNREEKYHLRGFRRIGRQKFTYRVHLECPEDIQTLFAMTPYSHPHAQNRAGASAGTQRAGRHAVICYSGVLRRRNRVNRFFTTKSVVYYIACFVTVA